MRRSAAVRLMFGSAVPVFAPGNTSAAAPGCPAHIRRSNSIAAADRGTRRGLPAFMRVPGIGHTAASQSISPQRMPRTSPDRQAVRIASSTARAAIPSRLRHSAMKPATSLHGRAGWCSVALTLRGAGNHDAKWPFNRAGFSPVHHPRALAASSTASICPRRRDAVSGARSQNGRSTYMIASLSTFCTGRFPKTG